jgi:phage shock protein A
MGILTRTRDIIQSHMNAALDGMEDPEKMTRMLVREMEDAQLELKRHCAGAMAAVKRAGRRAADARRQESFWESRAEAAVLKERDDMARAALMEKRKHAAQAIALEQESAELENVVAQYKEDIARVEEKLGAARERRREYLRRRMVARPPKIGAPHVRRYDPEPALARLEAVEHRIDRMEAEAELVTTSNPTLEQAFDTLGRDAEIEEELAQLKEKLVASADA